MLTAFFIIVETNRCAGGGFSIIEPTGWRGATVGSDAVVRCCSRSGTVVYR
jgi:hypothetical protein